MASAATQMLRRVALRAPQVAKAPAQMQTARNFAAYTKNASPETPLMHYTATQQATSSINHRIFYVNVVAMVLVYDIGSAMIDM
mmetsp:Transcript_4580/g.13353  ORF Transcript_4580/g.13353 Transcript_4580/m.13353 type:complete len:84 (+) Transcript_4580:81-332(+)